MTESLENSGRVLKIAVAAILLIALAIRLLALLSLKESIYYNYLLWDERLYHEWAMKIAGGTWKSSSIYEFPPFPAYVMALLYKILGPHILYLRVLNIILGVFTCFLVFLTGKQIGDGKSGLLSVAVAAFYGPFILYSVVPLKTALAVFLFALCVYLFLRAFENPGSKWGLFLGLVSGLLFFTRPNYLAVIPFLFLAVVGKARFTGRLSLKPALLFVVGLAVAIAPFVIRNYCATGTPALLLSQFGYNFFIGNNIGNPTPYFRPVPWASPSPISQGIQFQIEASRREGKKLSPEDASRYWVRETLEVFAKEPGASANKLTKKTLALFNCFEAGDHYDIKFLSEHIRFFKVPLFGLCVILPFGIAGMISSIRRSGKSAFLCVAFFLYALTMIFTFVSGRIRLPLLTIVIPFASLGVWHLFEWLKQRDTRRIVQYCFIVLIFFVIEFLPLKGTGERSAYYNTHALILSSLGRQEEAVSYWTKSSEMNQDYSAFADLALARKFYGRGEKERAFRHLERIPDTSFAAAQKYALAGTLYTATKDYERAISSYRRSLEINSGDVITQKRLVEILERADPAAAEKEKEKLTYLLTFYDSR